MNKALTSSARSDWQTPEHVLDLVRQVAPIYLDPCTAPDNPTGAEVFLVEGALGRDWPAGGLCYCNPPYGREIARWTAKLAEYEAPWIALLPARTDTQWWHALPADAWLAWRGRLRFRGAPAGAPFPSAIAWRGPEEFQRRARDVFSPFGKVYRCGT